MATLTDADLARWRLRSQHLTRPHLPTAADVVEHLLAVQAENPQQSAWAVAGRTETPDPADLGGLLDSGAVLRTHMLRLDLALRPGRGRRLAHRARRRRGS